MVDLKSLIKKFLRIYPLPLRKLLNGSIFISKEERYVKGERVDGSYDVERGEVILWNLENIEEEDLFIVLTHEWGYKIYHEWLSDKERAEWLKVRLEEKIDFGLNKSCSSVQLPEEEYCTIFSVVSKEIYLKNISMKKQALKIKNRINQEFPQAALTIKQHIKKSSPRKNNLKPSKIRNITHREVLAIKTWIRQAIQN
jgi:hypothetical protein